MGETKTVRLDSLAKLPAFKNENYNCWRLNIKKITKDKYYPKEDVIKQQKKKSEVH